MCFHSYSFTLVVYVIALNALGLYFRMVAFEDLFRCYACKELTTVRQDYDYIVVGSGSAGSIIARRLAEDKDIKVALIEAGSEADEFADIPALGPMLQSSVYDWQYRTVPQRKACLSLNKRVSHWPMGKIVGGTSMLNNMVYVRGHPQDFAKWYKSKADYNYTSDILPYIKKLETSTLILNDLPYHSNLSLHIMQAAKSAPLPLTNGLDSEPGFSVPKATLHSGHRWTPWHTLSATINLKPNLILFKNSLVEKIFFKDKYEAYSIKYSYLNEYYHINATRGIVLAAGVIGTPKLLMLSGIGPQKHLKKMNISTTLDLPSVGDNLQDHVTTGFDLVLVNNSIDIGIDALLSPYSAYQYFVKSKGPWTSIGCENLAFFTPSPKELVPDLQFMVLPVGVTIDNGTYLKNLVGINDKLWNSYFSKINKRAFTILPIVLHPKSRGTVRLRNKNPKTPPVIDPKYLTNKYDVETLLRGIDEIKRLLKTEPMKNIGAVLNNRKFPGCEFFKFDTKPYWQCYVRHLTLTSYHPVGTCQLGQVVDFDFQVKGTNKLYVADGSVLPELPSGNPNGAIMMMAEKASDVIKYHRWLSENKCGAKEIFVRRLFC